MRLFYRTPVLWQRPGYRRCGVRCQAMSDTETDAMETEPTETDAAVVFLDDYQGVVGSLAPVERLAAGGWRALRDHLEGDDLVAALRGAEVVVAMRERTRFDAELLGRLGDLRLLVTTGMGNASIDIPAATEAGITVCGSAGRTNQSTAEMTWALILAVVRHLPDEAAGMRAGGWQHTIGSDLYGSTLGVVGLGRIGRQVAKVAQAFGMDVIAWSTNLDPDSAAEVGVRAVSKEELCATSDVITVHQVLSDRSRGLIGEADLRRMKATAVLVNTSRGPIVDEAALVRALQERWIAGAGLDVFDIEPLPTDHPLRALPQAVLTPHLGYVTTATLAAWYEDVVDVIEAWRAGAPIRVLGSPAA
jgi:phosphoglycerate dehydrogenase-like enzyme